VTAARRGRVGDEEVLKPRLYDVDLRISCKQDRIDVDKISYDNSVEKRIVAQNKTNLLLQILCRNNQHVEDTNVEKGLS
jgi:hypothetical protein